MSAGFIFRSAPGCLTCSWPPAASAGTSRPATRTPSATSPTTSSRVRSSASTSRSTSPARGSPISTSRTTSARAASRVWTSTVHRRTGCQPAVPQAGQHGCGAAGFRDCAGKAGRGRTVHDPGLHRAVQAHFAQAGLRAEAGGDERWIRRHHTKRAAAGVRQASRWGGQRQPAHRGHHHRRLPAEPGGHREQLGRTVPEGA